MSCEKSMMPKKKRIAESKPGVMSRPGSLEVGEMETAGKCHSVPKATKVRGLPGNATVQPT
jgi:hypothetical protein